MCPWKVWSVLSLLILEGSTQAANGAGDGKPSRSQWILGRDEKGKLLRWLLGQGEPALVERSGPDGFFNNLFEPEQGAIDTRLLRRSAAQYQDGVFEPSGRDRPNPFDVSRQLMSHSRSPGSVSKTGKTALLVFFGQQLVEEILDAQKPHCPPEYFNIDIPADHEYRNLTGLDQMPLLRTRYDASSGTGPNNPRHQLNELTPYIDGNLVYGTSPWWTDLLRRFENGTLAPKGQLAWSETDGPGFPPINKVNLPMFNPPPPTLHPEFVRNHQTLPAARHFLLGNPRGNENPMLLSLGIVWFRWHNSIARTLADLHPDWRDDQLFHEARKWVIATYQHLVSNLWLPEWLGQGLPPYQGYDAAINPQIDQLFQTAAMRFGHTLVPSGVYLRHFGRDGCQSIPVNIVDTQTLDSAAVRTCNSFWRPQDVLLRRIDVNGSVQAIDIDRLLMGMASQLSESEDHLIVPDLRGFVFGPMEFPRRDLMAINIQRGRDHGVPDYNTARKSMGLQPIASFKMFINQTGSQVPPEVIDRMATLYGDRIDDVDLWVGGLLETGLSPGPLFKSIILDQFNRIRAADRFWYKNLDNGLFTPDDVERLEQLTLYDVIMAVTRMDADDLQENPFLSPTLDIAGQQLSPVCMERLKQKTPCVRRAKVGSVSAVPASDRPADLVRFTCAAFFQPGGSAEAKLEECSPPSTYSYFSGSHLSFTLTMAFEMLTIVGALAAALILLRWKRGREESETKAIGKLQIKRSLRLHGNQMEQICTFTGTEWLGHKDGVRPVNIVFDGQARKIQVRDETFQLVRTINLARRQPFFLIQTSNTFTVVLQLPKEYDLVLKCTDQEQRSRLLDCWRDFLAKSGLEEPPGGPFQRHQSCQGNGVDDSTGRMLEEDVLCRVVTHRQRRIRLEQFFRSVFSEALSISKDKTPQTPPETYSTELTRDEFAAQLRMTSDSEFVVKMFDLVDKDQNGAISFHEFLDLMIIFSKGRVEDKLKLLFDMYDTQRAGRLHINDFTVMIGSLVALSDADIDREQMAATVHALLSSVRLENKDQVTLAEFSSIMSQHRDTLDQLEIGFARTDLASEFNKRTARGNRYNQVRKTLVEIYKSPTDPGPGVAPSRQDSAELWSDDVAIKHALPSGLKGRLSRLFRLLDRYRLEAFWTTLFMLLLWGIFLDQAYVYAVEREHVGLRQATGYGVSITRGAASAIMFCLAVLLVVTCRHVVTYLRDTVLVRYVPLDGAMAFHQFVSWWAVFFAAVHTVGHAFNFYHLSTQPAADLACLFREHYFGTHVLPKYHDWIWATLTGVTGLILLVLTTVIFVFSLPSIRRRLSGAFWITHKSYPTFLVLTLLHGSGRLVQAPYLPYYLAGPLVLLVLDGLISIRRRRLFLPVLAAQLLPSDVTKLIIQRPPGFNFRSGQYVRISCPSLGDSVFHAFTVSSAPQASHLTLHIRAVGPWTKRLRHSVSRALHLGDPLPKVYLDGPYGEAHQDWPNYPVSVLIGAGIGVTPFASILQDVAHGARRWRPDFKCRKVYFVWITRDQRQFEWMVDLLRHVEAADVDRLISTNIFITQFAAKFDIRTVMMYVCERQFQKVEQRSLFTGLRAVTHFGHPNFAAIFEAFRSRHSDIPQIGVFSCGPRPMTRDVESACRTVSCRGPVDFRHHYENY